MGSSTIQAPDSSAPETEPHETSATTPAGSTDGRSSGESRPPPASLPQTADQGMLRFPGWLYRSHSASVLWLVVRLWLGYQWLNAGYQKVWGSEHSVFWFGNGAAVKGFATAGVAGSASGKGGASYGWWAGFLHNFVVPNASWIGKLISLAEILIGVALILGLLTGAAAAAGLSLNLIYMFSGSAGVNPMYAVLSVLLVLAWRNAGWIGLDRFILGRAGVSHRLNRPGRLTRRQVAVSQ
jgi:thiosulfate dehydrogenase (quinone) large subunit